MAICPDLLLHFCRLSSRWVAPVQLAGQLELLLKPQVCTEGPQLDKISQDEFSLGHTSRILETNKPTEWLPERVDGLMDVSVTGRTSRHSPARRHSMRAKDAQLDSHGLTRLWTMISCDELYIMNYDELWTSMNYCMMNYDELCTVGSSNKTWHGLTWYGHAKLPYRECLRHWGSWRIFAMAMRMMSGGASKDGGKRCYCLVPEPCPWGTFELCPVA